MSTRKSAVQMLVAIAGASVVIGAAGQQQNSLRSKQRTSQANPKFS